MKHWGDILLTDEAPEVYEIEKLYTVCRKQWLPIADLESGVEVVKKDEADRVDCPGCLEFLAQQVSGILGGSTSGRRVHARSYTAVPCIKDGTLNATGGHMQISHLPLCGQAGKAPLMSSRREEINCTRCGGSDIERIPWEDGEIVPLLEFAKQRGTIQLLMGGK